MSKRFIPYSWHQIDSQDIRAVVQVLKTSWITQGPNVDRFEEAFARFCRVPYAVAVSSGTAGLHLACLAAGVGPGDEVITSPLTFVATANSIFYCGGRPRFADIEDVSQGLDPRQVMRAVTSRTKGINLVHFAGQPCVLGDRGKYSPRKDFFIIEDACHALGAEYQRHGRWHRVGSCVESDMAVFSFHPAKHITTGEGGMVTTRRRDLYEKLKLLRSHGIEKNSKKFVHRFEARSPWYYEMTDLGFNYRITDIQCALGLSQLKKLSAFVEKRRQIAHVYNRRFKDLEHVRIPEERDGHRPSYHLYILRIDFKALGKSRVTVMESLKNKGVGAQVHYIPVTRQPYYEKTLGLRRSSYPVCEKFYQQTLSIPLFPSMTESDVKKVVSAVKEALGG